MTFKDYYKFPLKSMNGLEQLKVLTNDNKMAFDWCIELFSKDINKYISIINGETENYKCHSKYEYYNGYVRVPLADISTNEIIYRNLLHIRGWGMLTDNPYHLSEDKAKEIQDAFGNYIVKQLNSL